MQSLTNYELGMRNHLRLKGWKQALKPRHKVQYPNLLQKVQKSTIRQEIYEIIDMDISRSFNGENFLLPPEQIKNILQVFAFYNPEIGYCQGMNYVVGSLYLLVQDPD